MTTAEQKQNVGLRACVSEHMREEFKNCMQCGTCSGVCPAAEEAHLNGPRHLFALIAAGEEAKALSSDFIWMCTSCYACTINCPKSIPITDIIYDFKSKCLAHNCAPKSDRLVRLIRSFGTVVARGGRSAEYAVMQKTMGFRPGEGLEMLPLAIKLGTRGRIKLSTEHIEKAEEIKTMFDAIDAQENN